MQLEHDEDAKWMLQVAKGDRAAFARLFDRHQQRVVRFCFAKQDATLHAALERLQAL